MRLTCAQRFVQHYLSDVLAGYALGVGWSGFVYTVIERLSERR
jgi:membrane-associated phospholipid phosphatase